MMKKQENTYTYKILEFSHLFKLELYWTLGDFIVILNHKISLNYNTEKGGDLLTSPAES